MRPAEVLRAEERGRPGDEPREDGTENKVHSETERDVLGTRERPDNDESRNENPPEEREGRERQRRIGDSLRDRGGDIGHGVASPIAPPPT